ncbi:hypothetical protein [uncultured Rhodoferax sp.]|uniref:hypothetical protein n=1 Tax=uncultured Rhodoferax sp. TaxID=223188 RepID=UPI0025DB97F0|nr:hypothetical protein [uncultured Rhodoferax sp.]
MATPNYGYEKRQKELAKKKKKEDKLKSKAERKLAGDVGSSDPDSPEETPDAPVSPEASNSPD